MSWTELHLSIFWYYLIVCKLSKTLTCCFWTYEISNQDFSRCMQIAVLTWRSLGFYMGDTCNPRKLLELANSWDFRNRIMIMAIVADPCTLIICILLFHQVPLTPYLCLCPWHPISACALCDSLYPVTPWQSVTSITKLIWYPHLHFVTMILLKPSSQTHQPEIPSKKGATEKLICHDNPPACSRILCPESDRALWSFCYWY